jgi:membrane fusion protein, multidrug efflux system
MPEPPAPSGPGPSPDGGTTRPLGAQARRDQEIAAIRRMARDQPPAVQHAPDLPPARTGQALALAGAVLAVLLLAGGATLSARVLRARALARDTARAAVPTVAVIHPSGGQPDQDLVLPCTLAAYEESPIFARTSGYLVRWYQDIGSRVGKGELLARIDTPELDQELNQARAARQQVAAQVELARITADRWVDLLRQRAVSAQETDQQTSAYRQAQANLAAADANVRRLEQLEGFKEVYAPFAGVLTRRNVDPGALIGAGATGRELFDLARVDRLRVTANVPEAYAPAVAVGAPATVTLQEFPGAAFTGTVARTAESIDPATRTLLTEVEVPNPAGRLLPGSFGQVRIPVRPGAGAGRWTVPVNAMLFRAEGARVAVIGPGSRVVLRPVEIGRDYGSTLEILGGLSAGDEVVVNPSDSLEDGQEVRVTR